MTGEREAGRIDADALWNARRAWPAAVAHLGERFRRVRELPVPVAARGEAGELDVAADIAELRAWAAEAGLDLDRELTRFFDEHMPLFVRPDAGRIREIRELSARSRLVFHSALPPAAAEAALRHSGILSYGALEALATPTG